MVHLKCYKKLQTVTEMKFLSYQRYVPSLQEYITLVAQHVEHKSIVNSMLAVVLWGPNGPQRRWGMARHLPQRLEKTLG